MTPIQDLWIVVPNWKRFQHYPNRNPVWIKVYLELLHDANYMGLSFHARGVLHGIWLEYATARGQLPGSTSTLTRRLGHRVTTATLDSLNQAGFITIVASKPLALTRAPALAREVLRTSKERASAPSPNGDALARKNNAAELARQAHLLADVWCGCNSDSFDQQLDALERELHGRLPYSLRTALWDEVLHRQQ